MVQILCWLTLGILSIWIAPYREQANVGYFQEIKKVKGIGYQPPQDGGEDDGFRPIDPFGTAIKTSEISPNAPGAALRGHLI